MSEEANTPQGDQEPIKQLKSEFERKLSNSEAKINELMSSSQALMAKLDSLSSALQPAPATPTQDLSALAYSDPEAYANAIAARVNQDVDKRLEQRIGAMNQTQGHMNRLYNEFPELADEANPLTKKALEFYGAYTKSEQSNANSLRLAVLEAATDLGIKPKSKRPEEEPMGSGSYGRGGGPAKKSNKLGGKVEEIATLLGLNPADPKVKESLIRRQQRDFSKYKPVGE